MFQHSHNKPRQKGRVVPAQAEVVTVNEETQTQPQSEGQNEESLGFLGDSETPPKQRRKRGPNKNQSVRQDGSIAQIKTSLESIIGMVVTTTYFSGKPVLQADGRVVAQHSAALIDAILNLCKQDKNVRTFFLQLSQSSAYGAVIIATLPIIIGILANHGLIPPLFAAPADTNGTTNEVIPNPN